MKAVVYQVEGKDDRKFDSVTAAALQLVKVEGLKVKDVHKCLKDIASGMGVSYLSVYVPTIDKADSEQRSKKYDIKRRVKNGQMPEIIAKKKLMTVENVKMIGEITDKELKACEVIGLTKAKNTPKQIAEKMGISIQAVVAMTKHLKK